MATAAAARPATRVIPGAEDAHEYARQVVAGDVVAGELVRLACARHLNDLEHGHERGLWFDAEAARQALVEFSYLPQSKGEWGGKPLDLIPWQVFTIASVFGWKRADGTRRFRVVWIEIARKNGKTTIAAGFAVKLGFWDDEPGAEVYCTATKRDQALISWNEARYMVLRGPKRLRDRVTAYVGRLVDDETNSVCRPLGSDEDSADGLNPQGLVMDEVHRWKSRIFFGVLMTAMGARRQSMVLMITTAGDNPNSLAREQHDYAEQVLRGIVEDDALFAFIPTIDDPEKWDDPVEWQKANPGLVHGVPKLEQLEAECRKAKAIPSEKMMFLQMRCNMWVQMRADPWLPDGLWDEQAVRNPLESLKGRSCYGGMDLASTTDFAAFSLWFPDPGNPNAGDCFWWFWIPSEGLAAREKAVNGAPVRAWVDQGLVVATPGRAIDYEVIKTKIGELHDTYGFETIDYDQWNATETAKDLDARHGRLTMVQVPQSTLRMNAPTKEIERLLLERGFRHGNDPVAKWMFHNAVLMRDREGNVRIDREKSGDKVDGVIAAELAVLGGMSDEGGPSVYEKRGALTF